MTIPATTSEILAIISQDPLSDEQFLQLLKLTRDQITVAMFNSEAITYLEIRNRRVQVSDPKDCLEKIDRLIRVYEQRVDAATSGRSSRTVAKLMRR